jgi:hypothetical protein
MTEEKRLAQLDGPPPELKGVYMLQTNGDANTNCFDALTDTVIPPQCVPMASVDSLILVSQDVSYT